MEIDIKISLEDNSLKHISEVSDLTVKDLLYYNKYLIAGMLIKHAEKRFFIRQRDFGEIINGIFLNNIPLIAKGIILEYEPCGQEMVKYTITSIKENSLVLKYENELNDIEERFDPEDDFYVSEGYDSEIVLPKKKFLELLYQRIKEFSDFEIENRNYLRSLEGIEYMNNLHVKAEDALASIGVPFQPYRVSYERLKELNKIKVEE